MRRILRIALIACLCLCTQALAAPVPKRQALRSLIGEAHRYAIDFLVFKELAEGELRLTAEPQPGRYRAELVARTLGVASWLSGERTQRYIAVMEETADGSLRSVSYESVIIKRKNGAWTNRSKRYRFDYAAGTVYLDKGENGLFRRAAAYPLPKGEIPVDMLTGFYNLRIGAYGPLEPGARRQIPTFTTKGVSAISVEVLTGPTRTAQAFFPATGNLLRVTVDPEVFDTGGADVYVWFDAAGRPARGIVEDVIGMGNVFGRLREEPNTP